MMFCQSCGTSNLPTARHCDQCGVPVDRGLDRNARGRSWIIGGEAGCDLRVEHPMVSARHCRLSEIGDRFLLEDLDSTNGTFVNGERIVSHLIDHQDSVTLGRKVPLPWPPPSPAHLPTLKGRVISIGRLPDNDVVLDYPTVSSHHARIVVDGDHAMIEDIGSTNGTALGSPDRRVSHSPLSPTDTVYFGSLPIPASRLLQGPLSLGKSAHKTLEFRGDTLTLGRDPAADVVLDYPMVSWRHARVTRSGSMVIVEDLGSTNGTFVNGRRISGRVTIVPGDLISLGSYVFRLTGLDKLEQRDYRGNVTIEARGIDVEVPGRRLVEGASLTIYPSELVGLMGPSGAGKTTLMNALNGYVRPSSGTVLFNGQNLQTHYDQFRVHIGYVPQDDIMHRDLTVREALYYTARLRLPRDMQDSEIQQRIDSVLAKLKLIEAADTPIGSPERKGLSGGQRKRVNLAMELLTDPFVLFLDEPTSGLSSQDALMVVKLLRELANEGKTILLTIHQPSREIFGLLDSVALVSKDVMTPQPGRLVYFGPAYPDAVLFFNPQTAQQAEPSPDLLLAGVERGLTSDWVKRYAASSYKRLYVDERAGTTPAVVTGTPTRSATRPSTGLLQWLTLVRRGFILKIRDVWNTTILLTQAPVIALLLVAVFGAEIRPEINQDSWPSAATASATVLFLMAIAALWFGCSNSAREIVGEWAIYHRERMVNLGIPSYVAAKLTILGTLCLLQCSALVGIVYWGCNLRGAGPSMFSVLLLTSMVGVSAGLFISAVSRTSEVAISLVPLILLPMVILGGMMQPHHKLDDWLQGFASVMPSRWAFEGLLLVEEERFPESVTPTPAAPVRVQALTDTARPSQPSPPPVTTPAAATQPVLEMAEQYFPVSKRSTHGLIVAVSAAMFVFLTCAITLILKSRDVH